MGDFNGVCAITNLAIESGDPVFAVVYRKGPPTDYMRSTYQLLQEFWRDPVEDAAFELAKTFLPPGLTDDYPRLSRFIAFSGEAYYSGYGWALRDSGDHESLVGIPDDVVDKHDYRGGMVGIIMVHAWVVPEIVKHMGEDNPLKAIVQFAYLARIQLFNAARDDILGQQYAEVDEMDCHLLRARLIQEGAERWLEMGRKRAAEDDWSEEDE